MIPTATALNLLLERIGRGPLKRFARLGKGLINQSYSVHLVDGTCVFAQRVNTSVFSRYSAIEHNVRLVQAAMSGTCDEQLLVFPSRDSQGMSHFDFDGEIWRAAPFISSVDIPRDPDPAVCFRVAQAFGRLSRSLRHMDVSSLDVPIPRFHDLSWRVQMLREAILAADPVRKCRAKRLIGLFLDRSDLVASFESMQRSLPLRVFHHDAKLDNVLFLDATGVVTRICDLDTLMCGRVYSDVGDLIRTYASAAGESEQEPLKVFARKGHVDAIIAGYRDACLGWLSDAELYAIPKAGLIMTYMQGVRFLEDYLRGDRYYSIQESEQNLKRADNQWSLLGQL